MEFKSKNITKTFYLCVFFTLNSIFCNAQNTDFWNNVRFGGGLGLNFGNDYFAGAISPSAIYEFNEFVAVGTGLNFGYSKFDDYSYTLVGINVIGLFNPIRELQLSAEFEETNINQKLKTDSGDIKDSYWYPAFFIGIGYRTQNVTVGIRYDVLYDSDKSIYSDAYMPFVRVYF